MIEMAQQTATSCKEKREKRASCPVERFGAANQSRFASLRDRVNLPGNVVANLGKPDGFLQLCASYPNKFIPTISLKLMGPDPNWKAVPVDRHV
ncbi:hypothetical protein [Roseibium sediminicola]|uniref:Uncharacterized protein n=1 Tax=Roseibium sediminicola TaxID=2933272 RepID=A0ABT0H269_9HYPH|nr:hypothetical protein [Roseibium sp. CAU 1639]MCK7615782.1 hypothetical protein [Roseibium sp. CAU 1639]